MTPGPAERAALEHDSPQAAEHRSRYFHAAPYVAGKEVVDIACGVGSGASILRDAGARGVIGFDLSWDALLQCKPRQRVLFCQGDGTRLPLRDGMCEVVTSFETVEHIPDYDAFLGELRRILRPGGTLVLSTPNALHTKPVNGVPRNPFHVREFTPHELGDALRAHFDSVDLVGQRPAPAFRPCPYWEGPEPPPRTRGEQMVALLWKVAARLPRALREPLWRAWRGVSFHPGERDFVYERDGIEHAHVLVAVCTRG